jgi:hypothetical protein
MATRAPFARLAHYSHEFSEACHIFFKNVLLRMSVSLESPRKSAWQMSASLGSPSKTAWRMSASTCRTAWQMSVQACMII